MVRTEDARAAFTALYEAQYAPVLRHALRGVPEHAAGDVVAETFMTAWRRFSEVPDPPLPWLLGVARRVAANQRRGETRFRRLQFAVQELPEPAEDDPVEALVERDAVRDALGRLSASDRELRVSAPGGGQRWRRERCGSVVDQVAGEAIVQERLHAARR